MSELSLEDELVAAELAAIEYRTVISDDVTKLIMMAIERDPEGVFNYLSSEEFMDRPNMDFGTRAFGVVTLLSSVAAITLENIFEEEEGVTEEEAKLNIENWLKKVANDTIAGD